jgi:hypothetical protein
MYIGNRSSCPDCGGGLPLVLGNGVCARCSGSGVNVDLSSAESRCLNCNGTGVCPTCKGSGMITKEGLIGLLKEDQGAKSGRDSVGMFSQFSTEPSTIWRRLRLPLLSGVALLVFGLSYCGYAQRRYIPPATAAIEVFHRRFAAGQDDSIILDTDAAWDRAMDPDTARRFFARIRRKMGSCSYEGPLSWRTNTGTNGTSVVLNYRARCTNGSMREKFTLNIIGGRALLVAYDAASNRLLTD